VTAGAPGTALVTGACGFVGSAVVRRLCADGWLVTGIDVPARARRASDGDCRGHDLTTPLPAAALAGVDLVIHGAALAGVRASWNKPREYWRANVDATRMLSDACRRAGVPRVIHISSISVYGIGERLDEDCPTRPLSPYGITKLVAEHAWDDYDGAAIVRLSNVYGPGQRPDMAYATFLRAAMDGRRIELRDAGRQRRTPTYIDDCVAGIVAATACTACAASPGRRTFNIAGPEDVGLRDVPRLLGRLLGRAVPTAAAPPAPGDPRAATVSSARARRALGYEPRTALREGLARQLEAALEAPGAVPEPRRVARPATA
jgi:nucleoside-diphosphate-sugar epimerase